MSKDDPHPNRITNDERDEPVKLEETIMLKHMREDLIDVKKSIDLNYRRCYYGNPVVNHMLKMIVGLLESIIEHLKFEGVDNEIEGLQMGSDNKSGGFGISKDDI